MNELIRPLEIIELPTLSNKFITFYPDVWLICRPTLFDKSYLLYDAGIAPKVKISSFLRDNYFVNKVEDRDNKLNELIK